MGKRSAIDWSAIHDMCRQLADGIITNEQSNDGGPGSGNWGHKGRPNKRGGSGKGGGAHNRQGSKEQGFTRKVTEDPFYHQQKQSQRGSLLGFHEAKSGYTPKPKQKKPVFQKPMLTGLSDEQNEVLKKAAAGCGTAEQWLKKIPKQMLKAYATQYAENAYKMTGDWGYVQTDDPAALFYRLKPDDSVRVGRKTKWSDIGQNNDVAKKRFLDLEKRWHADVTQVLKVDEYNIAEHDKWLVNQALVVLGKNPKHTLDWALKKASEMIDPVEKDIFVGGQFNMQTHSLRINDKALSRNITHEQSIQMRKDAFERNKKRAEEGRTQRPLGNVGTGTEDVMIHEYGHAVDATYGITDDARFVQLFKSYTEQEIKMGISDYAKTNIHQFFAECFNESYYEDQRQISKKAMALAEVIINDKR